MKSSPSIASSSNEPHPTSLLCSTPTVPQIAVPEEFELDETLLFSLTDLGISINGSKKALYEKQNQGLEECLQWIVEHINDEDFDKPPCLTGSRTDKFEVSEESLEALVMMGFSSDRAFTALKATNNSYEEAVDWLFLNEEIEE